MPEFQYRARVSPTEAVDGVVTADSRDSAVSQIVRLGYTPLNVNLVEDDDRPGMSPEVESSAARPRLSSVERRMLLGELADLLNSGVSLLRALQVIGEQERGPRFTTAVRDIKDHVLGGKTLHESLTGFLPSFHLNLIRAGELSGRLEISLKRLNDFEENTEELRRQIVRNLLYPVIILVTGILAVIILLAWVVPRLVVLFEDFGGTLPLPTRMLIYISQGSVWLWWGVAALSCAGLWFGVKWKRTPALKRGVENFLLRMPGIGRLMTDVGRERFCRSLGILLKSGVMIVPALRIGAEVVGSHCVREKLNAVAGKVAGGAGLRSACAEEKLFPPAALSKIAAGEESGRLAEVLGQMADSYERQIQHSLKTWVALLEPALILGMGLVVGFIAVAMLLPIFRMNLIVQ